RKGYLKAERRRGVTEHETPDCRWGDCMRCGVPGNGEDTRLALPTLPVVGAEAPEPARARKAAYRQRPMPRVPPAAPELTQPERFARYRFTFAKTGDARYLSHRNVMDLLERALRAAAVPVRYTQGYNPHIRLSMGPALPLGAEGLEERFDVECHAPVEPGSLSRANRVLPDGLELRGCEPLADGAPSLGKTVAAARWRLRRTAGAPPWPPTCDLAGVLGWQPEGEELAVTVNARQVDGPTPSPRDLLRAAGVPERLAPLVPAIREALIFAPPPTRSA
ncbi:MAG: radical SAM-linked protein/radical family uncharacterized protein, partial [Acidobacteria bacterium]|nr:radical SAM-linked protein/radical family uncharacterized protein [Acidobacteriota bacterium]